MSEQSKRVLRGGARAATGVLIMGASAAVAIVLGTGTVQVPVVDRGVVSLQVDTSQNARIPLVCTGAFAELGADPSLPTTAIPSGDTQLIVTGDTAEPRELSRELPQGSAPRVLDSPADTAVSGAELQHVLTSTLQGLAATSCAEPAHEQWLVGGGTTLGQSATVVLGNPSEVPATVQLTIYDDEGRIDSSRTAGVLVPAGSQRIVAVNGYAPGRERIAVRVESTGAAVTAALGISQTVDIRSYAVDTVTRQLAPATVLVVPAVANPIDREHGVDGDKDDFPVRVRVLAPGDAKGSAVVRALLPEGRGEVLGTVELDGSRVVELDVPKWDSNVQAIVIEADVPVVGGVFGSADVAPAHDYTWFAPAPALAAGTEFAVSVVPGGELVLANPGPNDATVTLVSEDGLEQRRTVELAAGTAMPVEAREQLRLGSTESISAAVRVVKGATIASYPVLPPAPRSDVLTVYTR